MQVELWRWMLRCRKSLAVPRGRSLRLAVSVLMVWAWNSIPTFGGELARLALLGTGAPEGTVCLFAHGFSKGELQPAQSVALRRNDTGHLLPTQINPVTSWPDGTVKVALLAVACPALEAGAELPCTLTTAQSPAAKPGDWQPWLAGRAATLTVATQGAEPWTFDLVGAARTSHDRWHSGPLAMSTRVETKVPPEAVGGVTSLRLVADIILTSDGILEVDSRLANDLMMKVGGGPATYAYKVTIDGQDVYQQAEATHIQYTAWVRRHGRAKSGSMPERPYVRPDYDVLVRGGFTLPWDRSLPSAHFDGWITRSIQEWKDKQHPYPTWGIARGAGDVGGRQEIGYRTYAAMCWIKTGHPAAQFLAQRQLEVGLSRPQNFWDDELGTWVNPEDWPQFTSMVPDQNFSPAGTPRNQARGFPPEQRPRANVKDHITIDHAHNPDYGSVVALLSGRRMAFDWLAMNAAWQSTDCNTRQRPDSKTSWRKVPPDHTTGVAWAPEVGAPQTRGFAWGLRDVCLAAALLPDAYPRRDFYNRNALAWIKSYGVNLPRLREEQGELAGWVPHTHGRRQAPGYMMSFVIYAVLDAMNLGVAGPHGPALLEYFSSFRIHAFNSPDFNWRNAATGRGIYVGDGTNLFTRWAQAQAAHVAAKEDMDPEWSKSWPGEGDWQRNTLAGLALLRDAPLSLELRAKAADAMVLFRSERQHGREGHPRITPGAFFTAFENLNSLCPYGATWKWDAPPVVRAGQSFTVSAHVPTGTLVGLVVTDGALPRASQPEGTDAFVIVEQPEGRPFSISRGGALRVAGKLTPGTHILKVYATTYDQDEKEHRGPVAPVTVTVIPGPYSSPHR